MHGLLYLKKCLFSYDVTLMARLDYRPNWTVSAFWAFLLSFLLDSDLSTSYKEILSQ